MGTNIDRCIMLMSHAYYAFSDNLLQGRRKHFTFGQAGFSTKGESVEMCTNRIR